MWNILIKLKMLTWHRIVRKRWVEQLSYHWRCRTKYEPESLVVRNSIVLKPNHIKSFETFKRKLKATYGVWTGKIVLWNEKDQGESFKKRFKKKYLLPRRSSDLRASSEPFDHRWDTGTLDPEVLHPPGPRLFRRWTNLHRRPFCRFFSSYPRPKWKVILLKDIGSPPGGTRLKQLTTGGMTSKKSSQFWALLRPQSSR